MPSALWPTRSITAQHRFSSDWTCHGWPTHPGNPYDFANPVSQNDLFAGRGSELSDLRYYLRHAATARRPINLALLGDRASGKTSLLNMIEFLAREHNLLSVRIDLDEGDTASPFAFFIKLFDAILTAVCREGAFGGLGGRTYQTYLTTANTQTIPGDLTFCPFLFPVQYAQVSAAGRASDVPVFDYHLQADLGRIAEEHKSSLVILFDECNVLSGCRVILEKLRNVFMNREGFMLVFAGTPQLFPLMD